MLTTRTGTAADVIVPSDQHSMFLFETNQMINDLGCMDP